MQTIIFALALFSLISSVLAKWQAENNNNRYEEMLARIRDLNHRVDKMEEHEDLTALLNYIAGMENRINALGKKKAPVKK